MDTNDELLRRATLQKHSWPGLPSSGMGLVHINDHVTKPNPFNGAACTGLGKPLSHTIVQSVETI